MTEPLGRLPDWGALYWLEHVKGACEELRGHLRLLLDLVGGDGDVSRERILRQADLYVRAMGAMRRHLELLGWVTTQLGQQPGWRIDDTSLEEIIDFDRAIRAHPSVPVSLLLSATAGDLSARMRVGWLPPDVLAALGWDTEEGEWHIGTHVGALPPGVRRYFEDLADVDEERTRLDNDRR